MNKEERKKWLLEEISGVVSHPSGPDFEVTMTRWHWHTLDWITKEIGLPLRQVIEGVLEADEGDGFQETLKGYIEYFEYAYDKGAGRPAW
tara:strand:- start:262 stop:531 length:270 start_codon:yes stop_codon:yes gene_type:complete